MWDDEWHAEQSRLAEEARKRVEAFDGRVP